MSRNIHALAAVALVAIVLTGCKAAEGEVCQAYAGTSDCGSGLQCCGYMPPRTMRGVCIPLAEECPFVAVDGGPLPDAGPEVDAGPVDAGPEVDAGDEVDAGPPEVDAGPTDAGSDAGPDAGEDAGP